MQSLNIIQVSSLFNWIIFILVVFDRLVANYTPSSDKQVILVVFDRLVANYIPPSDEQVYFSCFRPYSRQLYPAFW